MYDLFSRYYDLLTQNIDYESRADYFCDLLRRSGARDGGLLLDLACGTGGLTFPLASRGWEAIGVDASEGMLSQAMQKLASFQGGKRPIFLCQRMEALDLYGTVDACVCGLDSLNHITDEPALFKVFERLALFIEEGGILIFDANTPYKHEKILSDAVFVYDLDEVYCVWQNSSADGGRVKIELDFFERTGKNMYRRATESFTERAYTTQQLECLARKAGFELVSVYGADTLLPPQPDAQRVVYVMVNRTPHQAYHTDGGTKEWEN